MLRSLLFSLACIGFVTAAERPRLAVLTDIGGDPDDRQSLVRLMVYSNEFEIELLLASAAGTPGELKESITRPELIKEIIAAYEEVLPNLKKHAEGWPEPEQLRSRVTSGNPQRGRAHIGEGFDTKGSKALIDLVDKDTPEHPLNISVWGGQTDLAQALWRVKKDRPAEGYEAFIKRLRIYDINDQDRIAPWIQEEFPGLFYVIAQAPKGRSSLEATFRGMYLTGDTSTASPQWINENIKSRGPLGALYPMKTHTPPSPHGCMKEGDTPAWFFFLPLGGNDPADPTKPGWGGQFHKAADGWFRDVESDDKDAAAKTVSRWRPAYQEDFSKRIGWTLK